MGAPLLGSLGVGRVTANSSSALNSRE
jgi:hypothetical protein